MVKNTNEKIQPKLVQNFKFDQRNSLFSPLVSFGQVFEFLHVSCLKQAYQSCVHVSYIYSKDSCVYLPTLETTKVPVV